MINPHAKESEHVKRFSHGPKDKISSGHCDYIPCLWGMQVFICSAAKQDTTNDFIHLYKR
jgi:hypothetical protein